MINVVARGKKAVKMHVKTGVPLFMDLPSGFTRASKEAAAVARTLPAYGQFVYVVLTNGSQAAA